MHVRNISLCIIGIFLSLPVFAGEWWHVYYVLKHCNKAVLRSSVKSHVRLALMQEKAMKVDYLSNYSISSKDLFAGKSVLTTIESQTDRMKLVCAIQPDIGQVKIDVLSDAHIFDRDKVCAEAKAQFEAGIIQQRTEYHKLD